MSDSPITTFQVRLKELIFVPPEESTPGIYIPANVVGTVIKVSTGIMVVWEFAFVDSKISTNYPRLVLPHQIELVGVT